MYLVVVVVVVVVVGLLRDPQGASHPVTVTQSRDR